MQDYKKLGNLFIELEETQEDLVKLKEIKKSSKKALKAVVEVEYDKEGKTVSLSRRTSLSYLIDELEKHERTLRGQIDRKLGRKWYQFWKLW